MITIELTSKTLEIMKNFSAINPSIFIRAGNVVDTLSISNEIMGRATITENFPVDVPIYDFSKLLNQLRLYSKPILDFDPSAKFMTIRDGDPTKQGADTRWLYSDPSTIHRPKKSLPVPTPDIRFDLTTDKLEMLLKAAQNLGFTIIRVTRDPNPLTPGNVVLTAIDMDTPDGTHYRVSVPADILPAVKEFQLIFSISNLKILKADYSVAVSDKLYSHWHNPEVEYFIALDTQGSFIKK